MIHAHESTTAGTDPHGSGGSGGALSSRAVLSRVHRGAVLAALTTAASILWRVLVLVVSLVAVFYLLSRLWVVVLPLLLALLVSSILWPVNRVLRKILPKAAAAAVSVVGLLALVVAIGWFAVTLSVDGVRDLSFQSFYNVQDLGELLESLPFAVPDVDELITSALTWLQGHVGVILSRIALSVSTIGSVIVTTLLALVLTFFCLKDGERFTGWLLRWTTGTVFVHVAEVSSRSWRTLSAYVSSQAAVALADAVLIGVGLWIVGIPLALPLAVLIFFASFLPVIGAVVSGILATFIALLSNGWVAALIVLGIVLLVQQIESNMLQPLLVGKSLDLHPAVVLTGVTAGGTLFGIAGAFLATPVIAVVVVAFQYAREQMLESVVPAHADVEEKIIAAEPGT